MWLKKILEKKLDKSNHFQKTLPHTTCRNNPPTNKNTGGNEMDYKANDILVEKTEAKSPNALVAYANAWAEKKQNKGDKKDA